MEVLQSTKKDLDRLREYAFQVVRDFVFSTLKSRSSVTKNRKKATPSTSFFFLFFLKKKSDSFFLSKNVKERNVFLLNEYHHSKPKKSKPWPEDILRIRATIYKQRHVHSKHMKRKSKKSSSSASQNLLEEEKEMAPTANPCSMTTSRTTTNNISSKSANDTTCNTTTYSSEESVEMSGADTAFNHHQMVDVSCGTRTLTSDAETNTYLNNSYAFINNEMSSGYIENEDDQLNDDEYQYQTHRGHPSLPPSFKNTNTKTKMYTTTSAANSEYSSGSAVDFFNVTAPTFINNDNNENGQNSVGGRKRKKPTSSFSAARSKLSKRAAANNNFKKGGETEEEQPSNTALAFSMPHMLNMDAIFGIDGSVERDDEDTALSPNSYGITIASFKETKGM